MQTMQKPRNPQTPTVVPHLCTACKWVWQELADIGPSLENRRFCPRCGVFGLHVFEEEEGEKDGAVDPDKILFLFSKRPLRLSHFWKTCKTCQHVLWLEAPICGNPKASNFGGEVKLGHHCILWAAAPAHPPQKT